MRRDTLDELSHADGRRVDRADVIWSTISSHCLRSVWAQFYPQFNWIILSPKKDVTMWWEDRSKYAKRYQHTLKIYSEEKNMNLLPAWVPVSPSHQSWWRLGWSGPQRGWPVPPAACSHTGCWRPSGRSWRSERKDQEKEHFRNCSVVSPTWN